MTRLTDQEGKRLCELVHLLRRHVNGPAWDLPGIEYAIRSAAKEADAADVCVAAVRASQNAKATTPGLIPLAGDHWQQTARGGQSAHPMCPEHPSVTAAACAAPDGSCALEAATTDQDAGKAAMRAAVADVAQRVPQRTDQRRKGHMTPALRAELDAIQTRRAHQTQPPADDAEDTQEDQ